MVKRMEKDISRFLSDESIDLFVNGNIHGALGKMMLILQCCGYNIEKYINNYYNGLNPRDYNLQVTSEFFIADKNGNLVNYKQVAKMKEDHRDEFAKIIAFFEKHGMFFDKYEPDRYGEYISCHMDSDKMLQDDKVRGLFRTALRLYMIDIATLDPEKISGI